MAQNERGWSQPPLLTSLKSRPGCSRGLGSEDLDDIGDIVNAISCAAASGGQRIPKPWRSSDCCLKNGLAKCHCLSAHSEPQRKTSGYPKAFNRNTLPYEKKPSWSDNVSNRCYQDNKMLEEFILDDNELCLLNYYDIPLKVPRSHHVRNSGKVKTVSIIDTLSELASGATDREDEGGFSSTVSESAVLSRYLHKPKVRPARSATSRLRDAGITGAFVPVPKLPHEAKRSAFSPPRAPRSDYLQGSLPCNSLKRTLKYLRKAVAPNVVQEERNNRWPPKAAVEEDAFRLCFSDSEVKEAPLNPIRYNRVELAPRVKSKSLLAIAEPSIKSPAKSSTALFRNRSKSSVPDWIQNAFAASKKSNLEKLKSSLRDIDPALVRNLSDDHGNNLWHICAVYNNFKGLNWLCSHNPHHADALKDENKNGFSPAALAVKHGSILAVQWLVHNTVCKSQLMPQQNSRSLLHIAARYGQCSLVIWLLNYMSSQDLDATAVDSEGNTALHLAAKYGHISCVKALVFHLGNLKSKNELGLKPLDLSVKHGKADCADFLASLESCYNLASLNIQQSLDIQHLQRENAEMKSYFKELLTLTKRLQLRQKELMQSFTRMNIPQQMHPNSSDWSNEKNNRYLDELLATVMTDEEHRLLMVENKWKKSRKQANFPDNKKKPLDILRSQFNRILDKVDSLSPPLPSTPESSDGSWHGSDEEGEKALPDFSAPDVVNSLFPQTNVAYMGTKQKYEKAANVDAPAKVNEKVSKCSSTPENLVLKKTTPPSVSSSNRDVNLRMFFKQNPNLRQSGETCSVLEVLEPSSSEGEECLNYKRKLAKNLSNCKDKEAEQSSSSSALETLEPYCGRPSSSGSKASGSHSSSSGSRPNHYCPPSSSSQVDSYPVGKASGGSSNQNLENNGGSSQNQMSLESSFSPEPDLIKGTQKKKMVTSFIVSEKEKKPQRDIASDTVLIDNPNISTDSESLEVDRSFSSLTEMSAEAIATGPGNSESAMNGTPGKKKSSFLFKFALRGRWPNKGSIRSLKNEISPQEFRETYSRSTPEDSSPTSQTPTETKKNCPPVPKSDEDAAIEAADVEASPEGSSECNGFSTVSSTPEKINQSPNPPPNSRKGLLPPRRDPPPAPPLNVEEEPLPDHSDDDDDVSISIQKSSISSCGEPHSSFLNSRSPDMWHASKFRPASSASRVDSPSRENFPLNKSSSASTEMLSALDSSTAGRQSPAPSEVSKTESALSPPSDVSKTESTRYLSQLGKIEESGHLAAAMKASNLQSSNEQNIKENNTLAEAKPEVKPKKSKKNSNKPWYEFSDEEDVIVPQRYKAVSVGMQSSSDDEVAVAS